VNANVFTYLTAFLREFLGHPSNKLTVEKLACVFSEVLFRTPPELRSSELDGGKLDRTKKKSAFISHFLNPMNYQRVENNNTL